MSHPLVRYETIRKGDRLYRPLLDFLTAYDCVSVTAQMMATGQAKSALGDHGIAFAAQLPLGVKHVVGGLAQSALAGEVIAEFPIEIIESEGAPQIPNGHAVTAFQRLIMNLIAPLFVIYFESHRPWLSSVTSGDPYIWPAVWNFSRVVRNAIAHDGRIAWNSAVAPAVEWEGIRYSPADDGREIIGPHLTLGDLLITMLEMDRELSRLGHRP